MNNGETKMNQGEVHNGKPSQQRPNVTDLMISWYILSKQIRRSLAEEGRDYEAEAFHVGLVGLLKGLSKATRKQLEKLRG